VGFTLAKHRQIQRELEWRSRCGHEISELLALASTPCGTVWAFGPSRRPTTPVTDFCSTVRAPCGSLSPSGYPGTRRRFPGVSPQSSSRTCRISGPGPLMDMDFVTSCPCCLISGAVRQIAISFLASFRRSLAVPPLRFTRASPRSGCTGDFHHQTVDMPSIQDAARRLQRCPAGLQDRRRAQARDERVCPAPNGCSDRGGPAIGRRMPSAPDRWAVIGRLADRRPRRVRAAARGCPAVATGVAPPRRRRTRPLMPSGQGRSAAGPCTWPRPGR
jgi:hypothetical protein